MIIPENLAQKAYHTYTITTVDPMPFEKFAIKVSNGYEISDKYYHAYGFRIIDPVDQIKLIKSLLEVIDDACYDRGFANATIMAVNILNGEKYPAYLEIFECEPDCDCPCESGCPECSLEYDQRYVRTELLENALSTIEDNRAFIQKQKDRIGDLEAIILESEEAKATHIAKHKDGCCGDCTTE